MQTLILEVFNFILLATLWFCVPFVIVGILTGIIQTVFSVQDAALSFAAKLIVLLVVLNFKAADFFQQAISLFKLI